MIIIDELYGNYLEKRKYENLLSIYEDLIKTFLPLLVKMGQ